MLVMDIGMRTAREGAVFPPRSRFLLRPVDEGRNVEGEEGDRARRRSFSNGSMHTSKRQCSFLPPIERFPH